MRSTFNVVLSKLITWVAICRRKIGVNCLRELEAH